MVKSHSGTEDSTSPGGTMDFTGRWERRFKNKTKKKNPLEETHLKASILFTLTSIFLPKQQVLAMNIQNHPETDLLIQSPPHHPVPPHWQQRHKTSSPAIILTISSIDWMAEPFPEKSFFTHLQGGIEKNPLEFLPGLEVQQQGPAQGKWSPKGWGVDGITNLWWANTGLWCSHSVLVGAAGICPWTGLCCTSHKGWGEKMKENQRDECSDSQFPVLDQERAPRSLKGSVCRIETSSTSTRGVCSVEKDRLWHGDCPTPGFTGHSGQAGQAGRRDGNSLQVFFPGSRG